VRTRTHLYIYQISSWVVKRNVRPIFLDSRLLSCYYAFVVSTTLPVSLPPSRHSLAHARIYLSPFLRYACAQLSRASLLSPSFSIASAHLRPKHRGWHTLSSRAASPCFTLFALTAKKSEKSESPSPLFSTTPPHSSSLFVTLKPVSPLLATHTKSTPGHTPPRHEMCTIVLLTPPLSSALSALFSSVPLRAWGNAANPGFVRGKPRHQQNRTGPAAAKQEKFLAPPSLSFHLTPWGSLPRALAERKRNYKFGTGLSERPQEPPRKRTS
jgi:hypothetical protein